MLQISSEIPTLIERIKMVPTQSELQDLSDQISVPSLQLHTMSLWLLMLDSYGIELSMRLTKLINESLKSKGTYRAKAQHFALASSWVAIQAQLQDTRLANRIEQLPQLMQKDPAKAQTFKMATQLAILYPQTLNVEANAARSKVMGKCSNFCNTVVMFQKKQQEALGDISSYTEAETKDRLIA